MVIGVGRQYYLRAMYRLYFLFFLLTGTFCAAQEKTDVLVGIQLDMVKSDYNDHFERGQFSIEGNYFLSEHLSVTGGAEYWTDPNQLSAVVGARWFPIKEAFVRARGLFGAKDISIGGGWTRPMNEYWRFEAIGDFYFEGQIAIRAGITYMIRKKYHTPSTND